MLDSAAKATLWEHLQGRASATRRRCAGRTAATSPAPTATGRTSPRELLQMTESMLVSAQLAYVYPRLAELADLRGDRAFAASCAPRGASCARCVSREWTGQGLVLARLQRRRTRSAPARSSASRSRGRCSPARRAAAQARTLVAQHPPLPHRRRRAPRPGGPARIGSCAVTRRATTRGDRAPTSSGLGVDDNNAVAGRGRGTTSTAGSPGRSASSTASCRARPLRVGRVHAQHARRARRRVPAPLGRHHLGRRRVQRVLRELAGHAAASASTATTRDRSPSSPPGWS